MRDSIDRQMAIDVVSEGCQEWRGIFERCEEKLLALPSAEPEIIRCKDCKHYYYADNRIPQEQRYSCDLDGDRWKPEDFCSYAERRTDEKVDLPTGGD